MNKFSLGLAYRVSCYLTRFSKSSQTGWLIGDFLGSIENREACMNSQIHPSSLYFNLFRGYQKALRGYGDHLGQFWQFGNKGEVWQGSTSVE
jgi:hypothetical protein